MKPKTTSARPPVKEDGPRMPELNEMWAARLIDRDDTVVE